MANRDDDSAEGHRADIHRRVAVALSYAYAQDEAPRVVATGRGLVAERILDIAFASGVRVRRDADLAEILAAVDLDSLIPLEAFTAVAEILAYVYRANGQMADLKTHLESQPLNGRTGEGQR